MKRQGIIDFSEPEVSGDLGLITPSIALDGSTVYFGDIDTELDRSILGFDEFTISYHGLINYSEASLMTYEPRQMPHVAICGEELNPSSTEPIMSGEYINRRQFPDSLQGILGGANEHSLGYANLARYALEDNERKKLDTNLEVGVLRGIGDMALRSLVVKYILSEVDREKGMFVSGGSIPESDLEEIIFSEEFVTSYALDGDSVEAVVVLGDTPSSLPWFNESRVEELANGMGGSYNDVRLAFLALTSPGLRRQRLAPILFDLAFDKLHGGKKDVIICTECSPRSISYTPFIIARHLGKKYKRLETVTERYKASVYPKTTV